MKRRVGILTSGGDCPGLNATLRGVAKAVSYTHLDVYKRQAAYQCEQTFAGPAFYGDLGK